MTMKTMLLPAYLALAILLTSCGSHVINENRMKSLGEEAASGDLNAIDEIQQVADKLYKDIDYDNDRVVMKNLRLINSAFDVIGQRAAEGSRPALEALKYATGKESIRPFAADPIGVAAAAGDKVALEMLINYKRYGFLESTVVFALKPAAERNIPEAVQFMIEVLEEDDDRPLWHAASSALVGPANAGNEKAKVVLEEYSKKAD